jgi:hypothetical protein
MRFFDHDKETGITEHFGVIDGRAVIKTSQDITSIIDDNKRDAGSASSGWAGDMHHVARIPMIVVEQWRNELKASGAHDTNPLSRANKQFFISKINNGDFKSLRTKAGRV